MMVSRMIDSRAEARRILRKAAPLRPWALAASARHGKWCGALISFAWLVCCACMTNATSAQSAASLKIGAVLPFSGGVELYGRQAKLGIDLAAKEINAGGGILGRPVEVLYEDDKTDPAVALDATHKLIERDGVLAVVGPITSRNLNAITPAI